MLKPCDMVKKFDYKMNLMKAMTKSTPRSSCHWFVCSNFQVQAKMLLQNLLVFAIEDHQKN